MVVSPPSLPPRPIPNLGDLPLVIETQRLKLRPIALTDVDDLWPHVSDPALAKYMSWAAHADRAETEAFVQHNVDGLAAATDLTWAIELEGKACGLMALGGIKWKFRAWRIDRAELGYWIGIPHWNQGYVSEAAMAVTRFGFETLGLHKITVGCIEGNSASQKIIEKLGYRYLAKFEDDVWRDGKWWAHLRYEMIASEWGDSTRTLRFVRR